jgi:7-dehydrocholesterol reductase
LICTINAFEPIFVFVKAHYFPSHPDDNKFSGSIPYDMFMGIEFNPRIGKMFDFKLFFNGRPGIVGWTLINMSFAFAQYKMLGYVTNSMVLLNVLHAIYVLDFFVNEDWYLRTIDIAHDHFGFYLAWGDLVWLPFTYTYQSQFLIQNPVDLSWPYFSFVLALGLSGYLIFRITNDQKNLVRRTDGKCSIWGKPAKVLRVEYKTSDGEKRRSLLLCSGAWGLARHFNYFGDLLISSAFCLCCASFNLIAMYYIIYMTILLGLRLGRDDQRCREKYGKYWDEYCSIVKYKVIPGIY